MFFEAVNMSGTDICKLVFVLTNDIWSSCFKILIKWNHDWLLQYFLLQKLLTPSDSDEFVCCTNFIIIHCISKKGYQNTNVLGVTRASIQLPIFGKKKHY